MSLRLDITTTPLQWSMAAKPAELTLSTTLPKVEITSEAAKLEITGNHPGELSIDFTESQAAIGRKTLQRFMADATAEAEQKVTEAIGKMASDGDRMMDFKNGDAIVDLAYETIMEDSPSIEWAYKPGPEISYTPNKPQIEATPGQVNIELQRGTVTNDTQTRPVDFQITQYGRVDINVVGSRTDQQV